MSTSPSHAVQPLTVTAATVVPWTHLPGVAPIDVSPPSGGMIELPGPRTLPVRPHLELAAGPAGVVARVVQGDGKVAALALRDGEVVALPAAPIALAARSDGLWALYRDGLRAHDRHGTVRHTVALTAMSLNAAADDAVWVTSSEQAWHVDAAGTARGPFAWREPLAAFVAGGALCARDRRDGRTLTCLAPDGAASTRTLPVELAPFEQPLALDGDRLTTLQGVTLRTRRGADVLGAWTLQVAGIDAAGAGFAISNADGTPTLWGTAGRALPALGSGALAAASVAGDDVMLYSQGRSARHHGATAAPPATVDEASYRTTIFPVAWVLSPVHGIAARADGSVVLAASGPAGAAVLALRVAP